MLSIPSYFTYSYSIFVEYVCISLSKGEMGKSLRIIHHHHHTECKHSKCKYFLIYTLCCLFYYTYSTNVVRATEIMRIKTEGCPSYIQT